ncbi:TetR family transcriptional regulator [filamentous cyanobacterium CCP1]|nr:TetR family transcriptional regulator [filamentous cyanobacterium CCP2]PSB67713.1 TetR family transcriptional regulator [filamentous cyanobacterium CCP1]
MTDTKRSAPRTATRQAILQATIDILLEQGLEALTLDAAAQKAGVSKGGLLYHFPNKDALILGLADHLTQDFETTIQEEFKQDDAPGTPGQWTRAYVRAALRFNRQTMALIANLSAAVARNPDLLKVACDHEKLVKERLLSDGIDPVRATIIVLAMDGLWFSDSLALPLEDPLRSQVIETLLTMTRKQD